MPKGDVVKSGYYAWLRNDRNDDDDLASCVDRVVKQLEDTSTTGDSPGMLLGKIQSGKTRAFIGVIARAFDRNFDVAIILTKGTRTLSAQTVARLRQSFRYFIDEDEFAVYDIMQMPGKLTRSELKRKIIIVAKKQTDNLRHLTRIISEDYPELMDKKILLIDDEADLASVRFVRKNAKAAIAQGTIASQMDEIRRLVKNIAFLQVTATPFSLYLQPDKYQQSGTNQFLFKPKRPAFTELLPIHAGYVGGDDYFAEPNGNDPRTHLFVEVSQLEQDALRKADQRRIKKATVLDTPNSSGLLRSIITFVMAVNIRRWQQDDLGEKKKKYAMVIHNDTQTAAHAWQDQIVEWIFENISKAATDNPESMKPAFDMAYADLSASVKANHGRLPTAKTAFKIFIETLQGDDVVIEKVNSDGDVMALLDENAELRLRTPYNIFIGGNILDRGITIPNMISFYYGRNPKTMQADTVLQHSRMYGNRDRRDLAVTRYYTSQTVYDRLYTINSFENALRNAFETGTHDAGVIFLQADSKRGIRPCAPDKLLLSDVVSMRPGSFFLPTDFDTLKGKAMEKIQLQLDELIPLTQRDTKEFYEVSQEKVLQILSVIAKSLIFKEPFEWNAMQGLIEYYCAQHTSSDGMVLLLAETGRRLSKDKSGDKSGLSILGGGDLRSIVQNNSRSKPAIILLQQTGTTGLGWSGHKFWWPILAAPATAEPCIFATKVMKG